MQPRPRARCCPPPRAGGLPAVSDKIWERLRDRFATKYDSLRARLRRRLGSDDLAQETLHETWLQLARAGKPRSVQNLDSYLFGMALNVAANLKRGEARHASRLEIEAALEFADEAARPGEAVEARLDLEALERAISELPPRRRVILLAVRVRGVQIQEVADKLGLTRRSVEMELKRALEHCAGRLDRSLVQRFGPKPQKAT